MTKDEGIREATPAEPTRELKRTPGLPDGALETPEGHIVVRSPSEQIADIVRYPAGSDPATLLAARGAEVLARARRKVELSTPIREIREGVDDLFGIAGIRKAKLAAITDDKGLNAIGVKERTAKTNAECDEMVRTALTGHNEGFEVLNKTFSSKPDHRPVDAAGAARITMLLTALDSYTPDRACDAYEAAIRRGDVPAVAAIQPVISSYVVWKSPYANYGSRVSDLNLEAAAVLLSVDSAAAEYASELERTMRRDLAHVAGSVLRGEWDKDVSFITEDGAVSSKRALLPSLFIPGDLIQGDDDVAPDK